jgi:hypothetical protein
MGHVIGYNHSDGGVMAEALAPGGGSAAAVDAYFAGRRRS